MHRAGGGAAREPHPLTTGTGQRRDLSATRGRTQHSSRHTHSHGLAKRLKGHCRRDWDAPQTHRSLGLGERGPQS